MEGRQTGSEGLRKAEAYTVEQLQKYGLQPAGENGFYQTVEFDQRLVDEKASFATLIRDGKEIPIVLGEDAYFSGGTSLWAMAKQSGTSLATVQRCIGVSKGSQLRNTN